MGTWSHHKCTGSKTSITTRPSPRAARTVSVIWPHRKKRQNAHNRLIYWTWEKQNASNTVNAIYLGGSWNSGRRDIEDGGRLRGTEVGFIRDLCRRIFAENHRGNACRLAITAIDHTRITDLFIHIPQPFLRDLSNEFTKTFECTKSL